MRNIKLSNNIFNLGMNAKELSIYAYLCSIFAPERTLDEESLIHVKQSTIAKNCCIGSVQTVRKILDSLASKHLITILERSVKRNSYKGTYYYTVKKLPTNDSFFFVDCSVFGKLTPRQMYVYLFICKSFDSTRNDCWNSYNDIAAQIGMKRELIIDTINELTEAKFIVRMKRKSRDNKRVYVDNHYQIIKYILGRIKGKVRPHCEYDRTKSGFYLKKLYKYIISRLNAYVNMKSETIFSVRGSPQIESH